MANSTLNAQRVIATIALIAIALAIFWLAPPATRLFIALLALPLESLIVTALFSQSGRRSPRTYQGSRHSFGD